MLSMLASLLRQLWHQLLPTPCLWCSLPVQHFERQLCQSCLQALPQLPYALCHYNLLWLPTISGGLSKPAFDSLLSLSFYQKPYSYWLTRWKFQQDVAAGDLLQQQFSVLLAQFKAADQSMPEAILYVPMHPRRQRQRGFNQAQQLAEAAAKQLQIPLLPVLQRPNKQPPQVGLGRKARLRNLRHAFTLRAGTSLPAHIALVDDVITTGATINTLCKLLRRHGAQHISVWTVAVTLHD